MGDVWRISHGRCVRVAHLPCDSTGTGLNKSLGRMEQSMDESMSPTRLGRAMQALRALQPTCHPLAIPMPPHATFGLRRPSAVASLHRQAAMPSWTAALARYEVQHRCTLLPSPLAPVCAHARFKYYSTQQSPPAVGYTIHARIAHFSLRRSFGCSPSSTHMLRRVLTTWRKCVLRGVSDRWPTSLPHALRISISIYYICSTHPSDSQPPPTPSTPAPPSQPLAHCICTYTRITVTQFRCTRTVF